MTCTGTLILQPSATASCSTALTAYPANYDESLHEIHDRLQSNGHATKLDLAGLIGWKHVHNAPWMTTLFTLPPGTVEQATAVAFDPGLTDAQRVAALGGLPGFGPEAPSPPCI